MADPMLAAAVAAAHGTVLELLDADGDAVHVMVQLMEARTHAAAVLGRRYDERMGELTPIIKALAAASKVSFLEAGLNIAKDPLLSPPMRLFTIAATVEVIIAAGKRG